MNRTSVDNFHKYNNKIMNKYSKQPSEVDGSFCRSSGI